MKFLLNTITHWEEPPRARHQVAFALSKNHDVVFIAANKVGVPQIKTITINDNLTVIQPFSLIGNKIRYRLPIVNELYQLWLFNKLAKKYSEYEIINFDFTATRIFSFFRNVIYYCNDSFSAISKIVNPIPIARYHQWCEAKTAAKSKFCVAISVLIKEELLRFNSNVIEIPLGSPDIDGYNLSIQEIPSKNKIIKVGLVAVIKNLNISHHVINLILDDNSISLTLVGPIEEGYLNQIPKKDKLKTIDFLTGKKLYEEINGFDVTIAPYCTKSTNEIFSGTGSKIYHYLSVGKPVVISYMSGLSQLNIQDGLIYAAKEEEEFPALIHKAHEENTTELIRQRMAYAKNNTWIKRMNELVDYYKKQ